MTGWQVAHCLNILLGEIDRLAPRRSRASDGSIGDQAHASRKSDHNPDARGIVHARDFTHDPANGADMHEIYDRLVRSKDRRIAYLIWDGWITSGSDGTQPWVKRVYTGVNPHKKHLHCSTKHGETFELDVSAWISKEDELQEHEVREIINAATKPLTERIDRLKHRVEVLEAAKPDPAPDAGS